MQLIEVTDHKTEKAFLDVPHSIYAHDPNYIFALEKDIQFIFDPTKNPVFAEGEAIRWILQNNEGKVIGRVAAFINTKAVKLMEHPVGGMGFFECIENEKAAFKLFDACKDWLISKGMQGMDGPINFGERDRFWGLLIDGFDPPSYMENYNPLYYRDFFENYGFKVYFEQITYMIRKDHFNFDRFTRIGKYIFKKPDYEFRHLKTDSLKQFASDFTYIYNEAWSKFENFKPVTEDEVLSIFKEMSPIIIPEFIWFAYVQNEPAGFIVMIPDINQIFKYMKGKWNLWSKLKFLFYHKIVKMDKLKGLVFGIVPKYQNLGLDAALVYKLHEKVSKTWQFPNIGISWIGGFNPKMHSFMQELNAEVYKTHLTYRKYFDSNIVFKPFELGEYKKEKP